VTRQLATAWDPAPASKPFTTQKMTLVRDI